MRMIGMFRAWVPALPLALALSAPASADFSQETDNAVQEVTDLIEEASRLQDYCKEYMGNYRSVTEGRRECESKMEAVAERLMQNREILAKNCNSEAPNLEELHACWGIRDSAVDAALIMRQMIVRIP